MGNPSERIPVVENGSYARANLFVGKYKVPEDGWIRLPNARVRLLRGTVHPDGWVQDAGGLMWLIIEDDNFWPVMVQLRGLALVEERP